jgi:hypothetical protein
VADQALWIPVMRQRDAAVRTRGNRAAVDALDEGRVPAPVEKQDTLFSAIHGLDNRIVERLPNYRAIIHTALSHRVVIGRDSA